MSNYFAQFKLVFQAFGLALSMFVLTACAGLQGSEPAKPSFQTPPIVFVHGNGDSAALWQTTLWRFEAQGWPAARLHAIDVPYPLARDEDAKPQAGRTSAAEHAAYLKTEVEKVLKATGASQVVLFANSRGGNAVRNYIQNMGGAATVSHAILGGTPNHGVWAIAGFREGNEFSGTGPFLKQLNTVKNAAGDEVAGPVKWMTIRSDNNDKFAQPDGLWIGAKGTPTNVTFAGPELKGAKNVVIAGIDHRETSFSPAAFAAAFEFITGQAPKTLAPIQPKTVALSGQITGMGVNSLDAKSGNFANNLPIPGALLQLFEVDPATGVRKGSASLTQTVGALGMWGPLQASPTAYYEFEVTAPGYATTHFYRSPFAGASSLVHLRPERIADADKDAGHLVFFTRPRGYFDLARDALLFDGKPPSGLPPTGAGLASSKLKLAAGAPRSVVGEMKLANPPRLGFAAERIAGQTWPAAEGHVSVIELTQ